MTLGIAAKECVGLGRVYAFAKIGLKPMIKIDVINQGSIALARNKISATAARKNDMKDHLVQKLPEENQC